MEIFPSVLGDEETGELTVLKEQVNAIEEKIKSMVASGRFSELQNKFCDNPWMRSILDSLDPYVHIFTDYSRNTDIIKEASQFPVHRLAAGFQSIFGEAAYSLRRADNEFAEWWCDWHDFRRSEYQRAVLGMGMIFDKDFTLFEKIRTDLAKSGFDSRTALMSAYELLNGEADRDECLVMAWIIAFDPKKTENNIRGIVSRRYFNENGHFDSRKVHSMVVEYFGKVLTSAKTLEELKETAERILGYEKHGKVYMEFMGEKDGNDDAGNDVNRDAKILKENIFERIIDIFAETSLNGSGKNCEDLLGMSINIINTVFAENDEKRIEYREKFLSMVAIIDEERMETGPAL